jgi:NAD(P)-dependent dehydrogenase (short-subunit alcohol dehydrogenase family)
MKGLPEFDLSGKVFVGTNSAITFANRKVTGGARGLGLVQAEALIEAGAAGVFAFDRLPTPDPKYEDVRKKYPDQLLEYKRVDVTIPADLQKAFREVADWEGRLDGLVAAAGVQYEAPALEYTAEDCRRILDINVGSPCPFNCNEG